MPLTLYQNFRKLNTFIRKDRYTTLQNQGESYYKAYIYYRMSLDTPRRLPPAQVDCKWWMRGYCARGTACHFKHDKATFAASNKSSAASSAPQPSTDDNPDTTCAICFETPDTYGLLINCDHAFCLECIRNWRSTAATNPSAENELKKTSKTCPTCRSQSDYIIPSSIWPPECAMKNEIVNGYLGRLKTIPCQYFEKSIKDTSPNYKPKCQFGNHCHYLHIHPDTGEPYKFSEEELRTRRRPGRRRAQLLDEMMIMEMLFNDIVAYQNEDEWVDEDDDENGDDDFEEHLVFESEFLGLGEDDFDDFGWDYGWD